MSYSLIKRIFSTSAVRCSLKSVFNRSTAGRRESNRHTGLYLVPELSSSDGFEKLRQRVEKDCERLVNGAVDGSEENIVEICDELSNAICCVADLSECVRLTHPDQKYAEAAERCVGNLQHLVERLNTDVRLYQLLCETLAKRQHGGKQLNDVDLAVGELFKTDFEASGIHLDSAKRQKFVQITQDLFQASCDFMKGTDAAVQTKSWAAKVGVPKAQLRRLPGVINTPLGESHDSEVRRLGYAAFYSASDDQEKALRRLVEKRQEIASLCGFPTFSHRTLKGTLIESPERALKFLEILARELKPLAQKDFAQLEEQLKLDHPEFSLSVADVPFLVETSKSEKLKRVDIRPFLSLGNVMESISNLFLQLYGIHFEQVATTAGEVWSDDVVKLAVKHKSDGTVLGFIYCDFIARSGKFSETHFTIRGGRMESIGQYQTPVATVVLSFSKPSAPGKPVLLHLSQVENLFHEIGHAMHTMLGRTKYQHVTGTRTSTDFAEVPSNLMETFCYDSRIVAKFARRWDTDEPLSGDQIRNICDSRRSFLASEMLQQTFYSIFDLKLHTEGVPRGQSTVDIFRDLENRVYGLPYIEGTAWHHRFSHLGPYGSKYYSYLVARAVSSLLWQQLFKNDPFNRDAGSRYHQQLLAFGGEKPPMQLVESVLGWKPDIEDLVRSLLNEVQPGAF